MDKELDGGRLPFTGRNEYPCSYQLHGRYDKKDAYQRFKVKEYCIVDPANKTLEVYSGSNWEKPVLYLAGEGPVNSGVLKDLHFDLKEVFKNIS